MNLSCHYTTRIQRLPIEYDKKENKIKYKKKKIDREGENRNNRFHKTLILAQKKS